MTTQLKDDTTVLPVGGLSFVIVISTLNGAERMGSAIDEILGALRDFRFDVLVVDGCSNDGTDRITVEKSN